MIDFKTWEQLDLRIGEVIAAEAHPDADKLVVLQVNIGDEQRQVVAGIRQFYDPASLVGRRIVVLANLKPVRLRGKWSQGMLLAGSEEGGRVSILTCDHQDLKPGSKVS
jgi:methionyl-tRNA synthetase